ncbi:MAG: hypothetical protein VX737_00825 [Pseudomonadota bacterium]|nr:hypothetical protein [Pseudomonadota bacterium]
MFNATLTFFSDKLLDTLNANQLITMKWAVCLTFIAILLSRQHTIHFTRKVSQDMAKKAQAGAAESTKDMNESLKRVRIESTDSEKLLEWLRDKIRMIQEIGSGLELEMKFGENMSKTQENDVSIKEKIKNVCSEADKKVLEIEKIHRSEKELMTKTGILLTKLLQIRLEDAEGLSKEKTNDCEQEERKIKRAKEINKICEEIKRNKENLARQKEKIRQSYENGIELLEEVNTKMQSMNGIRLKYK